MVGAYHFTPRHLLFYCTKHVLYNRDDTIDTKEIENSVRSITMEGLIWGPSKIMPIAYGVNKLQVNKL